jgi:hypothetical protein
LRFAVWWPVPQYVVQEFGDLFVLIEVVKVVKIVWESLAWIVSVALPG